MTKEEVVRELEILLEPSIADPTERWVLIERIYRDVIKAVEADARDVAERLLFAKSE